MSVPHTSFPLVKVQEQLVWLAKKSDGGSLAYNILQTVSLKGNFDRAIMRQVLQEVTRRHEALRSSVDTKQNLQIVHQEVKLDATLVDFSRVPDAERDGEYHAWLKQQKDCVLELETAPLFKFRFIKFSEQHHNLVIIAHHLVSDGWSLAILVQEIVALYSRRYTGSYQSLMAPMQFSEYVQLIGDAFDNQQKRARNQQYWLEKYQGYVPTLNLPEDFSRPKNRSFKSFSVHRPISADTLIQLRKIGGQCGSTLFMVFYSAFALVLHRYSQQTDIVIGVPSSGRLVPGTDSIIGYLGAVLPLLSQYQPNESLQDFIRRQKVALLDAYQHEDFSFAELIEALPHAYAENRSALLDVVFNLQPGVRLENDTDMHIEVGFEQATHVAYDMFMDICEYQGDYTLHVAFNADVFAPTTGENFVDSYLAVLDSCLGHLSKPVKQLPLLSAKQRQAILSAHRQSPAQLRETNLSAAIEACASQYPKRIALVCGDTRVTFAQYNQQANQLARHLQAQGVGIESRVGVCIQRTEINYISYLAILKLGATFVPLDAGYPKQRLQKVIELSGVSLVLVDEHNEHVVADVDTRSLYLNNLDIVTGYASDNLDTVIHPDTLAYIIYTSGSTGEPKGVAIRNRSVLVLLDSVSKVEGIYPDETWLTVNSLSFDICILENFYPMVFGGTLVIGQREWLYDPETLHRVAKEQQVTICVATPSMWSLIYSQPELVQQKFKIITGGEALSVKQAKEMSQFSHQIWNFYGPTESTVWASYYPVELALKAQQVGNYVSIGKTLDNYQFIILDNELELVPPGVPGTLYIGGDALAREYLNRPELTADKFIPNPFHRRFAEETSTRLYNTGDVVKLNGNGCVDYISRADNQIKVLGFRIELSEIENVICGYEGITEAQVIGVADEQGNDSYKLAAYYVANDGVDIVRSEILNYLKATLPTYMVPGSLQKVDEFKLTESRKIDFSALPKPEFGGSKKTEEAQAETTAEHAMSHIWASTLGFEHPDINSSFFELGGHSLKATELVNNINSSGYFNDAVRLIDVFNYPSIVLMAKYLEPGLSQTAQQGFANAHSTNAPFSFDAEFEQSDASNPYDYPVETHPDTRFDPFPLTALQQAYWIGQSSAAVLGNAEAYNYYALELDAEHAAHVELAWNTLIARHDMLRMFTTEEGLQQVLPSVSHYAVQREDLRGLSDDEQAQRLQDIRQQMTFMGLPKAQPDHYLVRLSQLTDNKYCLHLTLSMMVFDGASLCLILDEMATLLDNPEHQFEPLVLSFRDCVLAAEKIKTTDSYQTAKQFWQERVNGLPSAPKLPLAKDIYEIKRPYLKRSNFVLGRPMWGSLKQKAAQNSITPSILAFSVFCEVLGVWSNSRHFSIILTLFNRLGQHPQLSGVIGDFTSTNVLEVKRTDGYSFIEAAQANQAQLLTDLQHRHYGGVEVLRDINLARNEESQVLMPIVFTSDLSIDFQVNKPATAPALNELHPGISLTPQVLLDFMVMEEQGNFVVTVDYLAEAFPENLVDDLIGEYQRVLNALAEAESQWQATSLAACPEQHLAARSEVNVTTDYDKTALLHSGFEQFASDRPDAVAVINADGSQFSYKQINQMAGYLADQLIDDQVRENDLVAILLDKGWQQTVATLAVLKSGAAYLPLNSDSPAQLLVDILSQSGTKRVITDAHWAQITELVAHTDSRFVVDDTVKGKVGRQKRYSRQKASSLAYVIYTSGSTGKPKGVMVDHTGPVNTNDSVNSLFNINESDRVLALSALSFDLSVYDIFGILAAGGAIVYPEPSKDRDPSHWLQIADAHKVTLWNSVPPLMQIFVDYLEAEGKSLPESLRTVMMSGDWIPVKLPEQIRSLKRDNPKSLNVYSFGGATEASIWSIYYPIDEVDPNWKSIPYGKPLANQQYYVLDESLKPVPEYVVGDLYIGGVGLAQGYLNDDIKTQNSFIEHPELKVRLYRTGDTGRYLSDGNIEFCGRKDTQVKIQGYRVELGQIQYHINDHSQVKESVVLAEGSRGENKRLVAYLVRQSMKDTLAAAATSSIGVMPQSSVSNSDELADTHADTVQAQKAAEKALFKLSRKGARRDLDPANEIPFRAYISQPDNLTLNFARPLTALNGIPGPINGAGITANASENSEISVERLYMLLACLCETQVASSPLPKFFYPSSGSLNPVQTYISIPFTVSNDSGSIELAPGVYYLNSQNWSLSLVANYHQDSASRLSVAADIRIYFVGRREAIAPLYEEHSEMLCAVEAGYMESLMESVASAQGLAVTRNETDTTQKSELLSSVNASPHDWLLSELSVCDEGEIHSTEKLYSVGGVERQSYRAFSSELLDFHKVEQLFAQLGCALPRSSECGDVGLYVYFKQAHKGKHYYQFDSKNQKLAALDSGESRNLAHHGRDNKTVEADSDFSIFISGNYKSPSVSEQFHFCGQVGQRLSLLAPKLGIGLCPIGWLEDSELQSPLALSAGGNILHSFIGGTISPAQMTSWGVSAEEPKASGVTHLLVSEQDTVAGEGEQLVREVKSTLEQVLAPYMVPQCFRIIDALPLTSNGKVDRKRLSEQTYEEYSGKAFVPPTSEWQKRIAALWGQTLNLQQVGIDEHFFALGGNSVTLIGMASLFRKKLSIDIDIVDLFSYPTVRSLAEFVGNQEAVKDQVDKRFDKTQEKAEKQRKRAARARQNKRAVKKGVPT